MIKQAALIPTFLILFVGAAQEVSLPADLRQHTLTQYNSSLFNPTFSLDRNNPESVSFWTRWQWQNIDADPTTLFLNYTRSLNDKSVAGAAFFQHNTGIFFNTGGVVNYAYSIKFNPLIKLSVGANLFGFVQELADDRFQPEPLPGLPRTEATNDFILQFAPGVNLSIEKFSLGLASENLVDYNFKKKESNTVTSDKIFMGMASYDFPVFVSDSTAYIRPSIYLRTIPEQENQIGVNALLSTQKYWGQVGYNNFYGISIGAGGTILNRFSLGAVLEFGTSASINSKNPSFEIIASYFLGKPEERRDIVSNVLFDEEHMVFLNEEATAEKMKEELEKVQASANGVEVAEEKEIEEKEPEEEVTQTLSKKETKKLAAQERALAKEQRKDSIATVKKQKEALALNKKQEKEQELARSEEAKKEEALAAAQEVAKEQQRLDTIEAAKVAAEEAEKKAAEEVVEVAQEKAPIKPEAGEKYEEVDTEDGLEPGFYLIANVFGTQKYFNAFMKDLADKGMQPKSFLRNLNNYNYAYLKRYDTMSEARKGRNSNFNGKYSGKTWIFRVVGK
ncbi:Erythrocyte binding protein 3 [hydrothermal vent metagenome]|uniref:Erythrocyte binding protein 3 n=1 Tax=hydrothermal vent metagenome TaxID=652676 RepID=A0A3B0TCW4_9ZZZZ